MTQTVKSARTETCRACDERIALDDDGTFVHQCPFRCTRCGHAACPCCGTYCDTCISEDVSPCGDAMSCKGHQVDSRILSPELILALDRLRDVVDATIRLASSRERERWRLARTSAQKFGAVDATPARARLHRGTRIVGREVLETSMWVVVEIEDQRGRITATLFNAEEYHGDGGDARGLVVGGVDDVRDLREICDLVLSESRAARRLERRTR